MIRIWLCGGNKEGTRQELLAATHHIRLNNLERMEHDDDEYIHCTCVCPYYYLVMYKTLVCIEYYISRPTGMYTAREHLIYHVLTNTSLLPILLRLCRASHRLHGIGYRTCSAFIYNTIQYNTIQYNTIQYNTIQYNTIQYNTIQLSIQYNTKQNNTIQYNTIQYNTIQYNTIQYNTIQYNK